VRLVRAALPRARIHWVLEERWRVVLEGHADLDGLRCLPRQAWRRMVRSPARWPGLARSLLGLRAALREVRPGLVLDFHGDLKSGCLGLFSGAPVRLGYGGHQQKEGNRWFNSHHVAPGARRSSRMERNLDLVRALGIPDRPLPGAALPLVERGRSAAQSLRSALAGRSQEFAVISPGASAAQAYKKPPAELLAAACERLHEAGIVPLVVWGPGEQDDAARVASSARVAAVVAPPTDLPTLAALLAVSRLFVGGDSGPLHLACAVDCPVVGVYGPTDPAVNGPWRVPFEAVQPPGRTYAGIKRLDRRRGFKGLTPDLVGTAVGALLEATAARRP
jgi:ADP-heptose:LPS heptosyltransferase